MYRKPDPDKEPTFVKCYKYGLLPPLNWGEDIDKVFRDENAFWNKLVEMDRASIKSWHEIFNVDPEHKETYDKFQGILCLIKDVWEETKDRKSKHKRNEEGNKERLASLEEEMTSLKAERKETWALLKKIKDKLKKENEYYIIKEKENNEKLKADIKEAYKPENSGLWWCNYNERIASYKTGKKMCKEKKDGSQLRFHSFNGRGSLNNQLQDPKTIKEIFEGKCNQIKLKPLPEDAYTHPFRSQRKKLCRTEISVCAYTYEDEYGKLQRRMVTFPMIMHQPISENEKVTNVAVVAHNVSGVIKWSVSFTCSTNIPPPDPSTHESKKICGINLGWRQTQDGLRIITIVDQDGRKEHILLDEIVQNRFEFSRALQSELDDTLNDYREMIRDWATSPEIEEDESEEAIKWKELAMKVRRSRTHTSMYDLAIEWRNWGKLCEDGKMHELPDFHPEWFVQLEKWRKADKRKRQEKDNIRIKAIGYRTELYRKLARKLAMEYAVISLGQLNLKKAAKSKKAVDQEDVLPAIARSNRHDCSLYSFNQQLKEQALKHGAILVTAERPVTKTCYKCGYAKNIVPPNDIIYKCKKCGSIYDRDINAATVALQDGISVGITP